jgi:hypothetical protein
LSRISGSKEGSGEQRYEGRKSLEFFESKGRKYLLYIYTRFPQNSKT